MPDRRANSRSSLSNERVAFLNDHWARFLARDRTLGIGLSIDGPADLQRHQPAQPRRPRARTRRRWRAVQLLAGPRPRLQSDHGADPTGARRPRPGFLIFTSRTASRRSASISRRSRARLSQSSLFKNDRAEVRFQDIHQALLRTRMEGRGPSQGTRTRETHFGLLLSEVPAEDEQNLPFADACSVGHDESHIGSSPAGSCSARTTRRFKRFHVRSCHHTSHLRHRTITSFQRDCRRNCPRRGGVQSAFAHTSAGAEAVRRPTSCSRPEGLTPTETMYWRLGSSGGDR